jgi:hypothetical protein
MKNMFNYAKKKIIKSKVHNSPYPFIFVRNLIKKDDLKELNSYLPSFNSISGNDVLYQSKSKTKKTILPSSNNFKKLFKEKKLRETNTLFEKLKPIIIQKFSKQIKLFVKKKVSPQSLKYHLSYSVMKNGYKKSPHLDRRDHLIHMIFYPSSQASRGGEIGIYKLKKKKKESFDVFPSLKSLEMQKKYKVFDNSLIIILNVPWAYHSVTEYKSKKDRKYFYMVYDFPIKKSGSVVKNRKIGFNQNQFWKNEVNIESSKRKKIFLNE